MLALRDVMRATHNVAVSRPLPHAPTLLKTPCHGQSARCGSARRHSNGIGPTAHGGGQPPASPQDDSNAWAQHGFPSYMQSLDPDKLFPCDEPADVAASEGAGRTMWRREVIIWDSVRAGAQQDAASEPLLSSFLYASILAHDTFEQALAFVLANRLSNATMLPTQLFEIFHDVLRHNDDVRCGALADLEAHSERDPSCCSECHALLYFKGYHAIQSQRIAHALWQRGQRVLALALQSRMSEVFAVDIHPAATIGKGILLDHGTGVVIGETAVIGDNCSLLQNVTLGGTGKDMGDRHPKVANNVLIGASATILGNILVGEGAQIAAGSLVLKPVEAHTIVGGSPAKPVGKVMDNPAETMLHWRESRDKPSMTASAADGIVGAAADGQRLDRADRHGCAPSRSVSKAASGSGSASGSHRSSISAPSGGGGGGIDSSAGSVAATGAAEAQSPPSDADVVAAVAQAAAAAAAAAAPLTSAGADGSNGAVLETTVAAEPVPAPVPSATRGQEAAAPPLPAASRSKPTRQTPPAQKAPVQPQEDVDTGVDYYI